MKKAVKLTKEAFWTRLAQGSPEAAELSGANKNGKWYIHGFKLGNKIRTNNIVTNNVLNYNLNYNMVRALWVKSHFQSIFTMQDI